MATLGPESHITVGEIPLTFFESVLDADAIEGAIEDAIEDAIVLVPEAELESCL